MIDIDVLAQLIPNPLTMLVQLCSTLVLFLLAKKFLWPSVKRYLDARSEKMQSDLNESEKAKQDAFSDREKAKVQLNEASGKAEEIVSAAIRQAKDEKANILEQADREAEAARKRAEEQINAERQAMYADMKKEMVDIAMSAAGKLIGETNPEELDRQAIDAFIKDTEDHGK
jgi:F-type H+-transporting ATPase subunit b